MQRKRSVDLQACWRRTGLQTFRVLGCCLWTVERVITHRPGHSVEVGGQRCGARIDDRYDAVVPITNSGKLLVVLSLLVFGVGVFETG